MPARDLFQVAPPKGGTDPDFNALVSQMNRYFLSIAQRLGALEGLGGQTVSFGGDLDLGKRRVRGVGPAQVEGDAMSRGGTAQQGALSRATGDRIVVTEVIEATAGILLQPAIVQDAAPSFSQIDNPAPSGSSAFPGGIVVGSGGTAITKVIAASAALDFPNTLAQTASDLTITVTGSVDGDAVILGVPNGSVMADSSYSAWVSASDTVTVRFMNAGLLARDPASGTFRVIVVRF